jgi:TldD protein
LEDLIGLALKTAQELGATYAEARFQSDIRESIVLKNGVPEVSVTEEIRGLNVRVVFRKSLGFSSTNLLSKKSVKGAARRAVEIAKASANAVREGVSMSSEKLGEGKIEIKPRIRFDHIDLNLKIQLLKEADKAAEQTANEAKAKLPARMFVLDTMKTEKIILNSDGAKIFSIIPRAALAAFLTAYHPQRGSAQRFFNLGESSGWEAVEKWNLPKLLSEEAQTLSQILMEARNPPEGEMDVVLGPEVVGIVCHESCGHPAEADRILGREAAQAGETYLKKDSLGKRVGSSVVNVIDDPTLPSSFGFYLYDEEGVKARKRVLIKEGVVNEFLHNRETASAFGFHSNAASRSVAYNREPIVRMANTFLEPGNYSKEELIEDVKHGVYIKNFMEWNIDDRRFNERYVGLEAYRIENGELKERVRNPVLEITTVGLWSAMDAVGKDLEFQAAYCGKGDPMQGIPVWTGGPHARLRKIRLGGM